MDPSTAALLEESEKLLRGDFSGHTAYRETPKDVDELYDSDQAGECVEHENQDVDDELQLLRENSIQVKKEKRRRKRKGKRTAVRSSFNQTQVRRNSQVEKNTDIKELATKTRKQQDIKLKARKIKMAAFSEKGSLVDREWENELARNILTLYHANCPTEETAIETKNNKPVIVKKRNRGVVNDVPPKHIWFSGTGSVRAVWCTLSDEVKAGHLEGRLDHNAVCSHELCMKLRSFEQNGKYEPYIKTVEALLCEYSIQNTSLRAKKRQDKRKQLEQKRNKKREPVPKEGTLLHSCGRPSQIDLNRTRELQAEDEDSEDEEVTNDSRLIDYEILDPNLLTIGKGDIVERMMWRQLVVCCNIFGVKLAEKGNFGTALTLLKRAEELCESTSAIEGGFAFIGKVKLQLKAFIWDSLGFYYFKRHKYSAAALYSQKAMRAHVKLEQWEYVAKCHLHCGSILSAMSKHEESIKCMAQILQMVEDERLQIGGTNAQKICLIAVAYHNITIEQIFMRRPAEACVSSQNGRRLARLSLSYANRWINNFESTHKFALRKLSEQHARLSNRIKTTSKVESVVRPIKNKSAQKIYQNIANEIK